MLSQGMWMQKIKGGRDSRPQVKEEDKTTTLIQGTGSNYKSKTILINESGLYSLILSSKLPQTRKFKRWVTSEVLGQIRKMGGYILINGCDLVQWFYSSIIFRDTHTIRIVRCGSPSYASSSLRLIKLKQVSNLIKKETDLFEINAEAQRRGGKLMKIKSE